MKVAILAGGTSAEREVSLGSGKAVRDALRQVGHEVEILDPGSGWKIVNPDNVATRVERTSCGLPGSEGTSVLTSVDVVFNTLHGGQGEDGTVNAVLELLGVPYTGSQPAACAEAMDKAVSKMLFSQVGVPTPDYILLDALRKDLWPAALKEAADRFGLPLIIKPAEEGSTFGLTKAETLEQLHPAAETAAKFSRRVVVEKFIPGRELTVGILVDEALPLLEIVVPGGFYDFEAKYRSGDNQYICPADVDPEIAAKAKQFALLAFDVLGLLDYSRIDFRLDEQGGLWCLEANNQPGMTGSSLFPKGAAAAGINLSALLEKIIASALSRR
jgi:D-alanine-D-alanine ligase